MLSAALITFEVYLYSVYNLRFLQLFKYIAYDCAYSLIRKEAPLGIGFESFCMLTLNRISFVLS